MNSCIKFIDKVDSLKEEGIYLTIEETMRGSHTLRLKTNENYGNLDKSFPPNNESIISIKQLIRELKDKWIFLIGLDTNTMIWMS